MIQVIIKCCVACDMPIRQLISQIGLLLLTYIIAYLQQMLNG